MLFRRLIRSAWEWREARAGRRAGRALRLLIEESYRGGANREEVYDIVIKAIGFGNDIRKEERFIFMMELQQIIDEYDLKRRYVNATSERP